MGLTRGRYRATPDTLLDGQFTDLRVTDEGVLIVESTSTAGTAVATATGDIDDVKVIDPDANGTIIALLKGILEALNEISTNTAGP